MIGWKSTRCFGLFVVLVVLVGAHGKVGKTCSLDSIVDTCGDNARCVQRDVNSTAFCECVRGFSEVFGDCVRISTTAAASTDSTDQRNQSESSGGSVAVGLLIPTFLLLLGGLGFCIMRRYRVLPCRRNLYGNVLVTREEDDDDDPPIA